VGSLAEPECARILAALDLAERMRVPLEWFALSAGAKISMESGTENMDWIAQVLRRLIEYTQAGNEVNIIVIGITVGGQPYWNAEATMLMHTRGILIMTAEGAMVLTGKTALDYSGSVSAEDNQGIGGYEHIMGPNGQAQYWARDIGDACRILLCHYDHTYVAPGERFPRRAVTRDPIARDVRSFPHDGVAGTHFATVGEIFSDDTNKGRKKPFDIRRVMRAVRASSGEARGSSASSRTKTNSGSEPANRTSTRPSSSCVLSSSAASPSASRRRREREDSSAIARSSAARAVDSSPTAAMRTRSSRSAWT
jgi:hypothetical protein